MFVIIPQEMEEEGGRSEEERGSSSSVSLSLCCIKDYHQGLVYITCCLSELGK